MLTGIHFLLTYACNYECDHCFLYCGPFAEGTFTLDQINNVLQEAQKLGTVNEVYFEGGEPFLYYPILLEGLKLAGGLGLRTGIVTNCYWATSVPDAKVWLGPVLDTGIGNLSFSDDSFHSSKEEDSPGKHAAEAAAGLGAPAGSICIERPVVSAPTEKKGQPVIGGGAMFRGRAVEKLTEDLPTKPKETFCECKHEELVNPGRVHVDSFGNVHVCQGISIGNMWETPLSEIITEYDASSHPICGPLSEGGPVQLAKTHGVELEGEFVDECHYCFLVRRELINKYPQILSPRQVYGLPMEG